MTELLTVLTAIGTAGVAAAVLIPVLSGDTEAKRAQREAALRDELGALR